MPALARLAMTDTQRIMLEHIADTWERVAADIEERGLPKS